MEQEQRNIDERNCRRIEDPATMIDGTSGRSLGQSGKAEHTFTASFEAWKDYARGWTGL